MNREHVSIDIETLGTEVDSVILSVAAVRFNLDNDEMQEMEWFLDIGKQIEKGRKINPATMLWWQEQKSDLFKSILKKCVGDDLSYPPIPAGELYYQLKDFIGNAEVWTNGPSFDASFLAHFFGVIFRPDFPPGFSARLYSHRNDRDFRTIKMVGDSLSIPSIKISDGIDYNGRLLVAHSALDDSIAQGMYVRSVLRKLREIEVGFLEIKPSLNSVGKYYMVDADGNKVGEGLSFSIQAEDFTERRGGPFIEENPQSSVAVEMTEIVEESNAVIIHRKECETCHGEGWYVNALLGTIECGACKGAGEVLDLPNKEEVITETTPGSEANPDWRKRYMENPVRAPEGQDCSECGGLGYFKSNVLDTATNCGYCKGTGRM